MVEPTTKVLTTFLAPLMMKTSTHPTHAQHATRPSREKSCYKHTTSRYLTFATFRVFRQFSLSSRVSTYNSCFYFLGTLREPGASGYGRGRQACVSCLPQTIHPKLRRQGPHPSRPLRRQEVPMHNVRKEVQREHTSQKTLVHTYR